MPDATRGSDSYLKSVQEEIFVSNAIALTWPLRLEGETGAEATPVSIRYKSSLGVAHTANAGAHPILVARFSPVDVQTHDDIELACDLCTCADDRFDRRQFGIAVGGEVMCSIRLRQCRDCACQQT